MKHRKARTIVDNLVSGVLGGFVVVSLGLFVWLCAGWLGADGLREISAGDIGWAYVAFMAAGGLLGVLR